MRAYSWLRRVVWCTAAAALLTVGGCKSSSDAGPPVPASSHPEGKDLVEGAIVLANAKAGGIRIYKIKEVKYFPPPLGDELNMIAFDQLGRDWKHASALYRQRRLTVALTDVLVPVHAFVKHRKYRVIAQEKVSDADRKLKRADKIPPKP